MKRRRVTWKGPVMVCVAALLIVCPGAYLGTVYQYWIVRMQHGPAETPAPHWAMVLLNLVLLFAGSLLARDAVRQLFRFQTRRLKKEIATPRRVLIIFLSELPPTKKMGGQDAPQDGLPSHLALTNDLADDLKRLAEDKRQRDAAKLPPMLWRWEQPLRGIFHNIRTDAAGIRGPLKRLILVCSSESVQQFHWFVHNVVRRYELLQELRIELFFRHGDETRLTPFEHCKPPVVAAAGWDFEDFDLLWEGLVDLLRRLNEEQPDPVADKQITIDWTGGPKPTTVAAAAVTINRELQTQYVCTNPRDRKAPVWEYDVLAYDLRLGPYKG